MTINELVGLITLMNQGELWNYESPYKKAELKIRYCTELENLLAGIGMDPMTDDQEEYDLMTKDEQVLAGLRP